MLHFFQKKIAFSHVFFCYFFFGGGGGGGEFGRFRDARYGTIYNYSLCKTVGRQAGCM